MACLLGIPKLQYTYILTPDCQPAFNPALRLGAGQAGGLHVQGERHSVGGVDKFRYWLRFQPVNATHYYL